MRCVRHRLGGLLRGPRDLATWTDISPSCDHLGMNSLVNHVMVVPPRLDEIAPVPHEPRIRPVTCGSSVRWAAAIIHRRQVTFDYLDTVTRPGRTHSGRPPNPCRPGLQTRS